MPDLPQFTASPQDSRIEPSNLGVEAETQAGRRIGEYSDQVGHILGQDISQTGQAFQQHVTFQQQSHGLATAAEYDNTAHQSADQIFKDPSVDKNDPTIATKLTQQNSAFWQSWVSSFSTPEGEKWATAYAREKMSTFQNYVIGAQSAAQGQAVVENGERAATANAQQASLHPEGTDALVADASSHITAGLSAGVISEDTALKIQPHVDELGRQIAMSGAQGAIFNSSDPVKALQQFYLDNPNSAKLLGDRQPELEHAAQEQSRSLLHDQTAQTEQQRQQQHDQWQSAAAQLVGQGQQSDGSWQPPPGYFSTVQKLSQAPGADLAYVDTLMNRGQEALKARIDDTYTQSDPKVYSNFTQRLGIAPGLPGALTKPEIVAAGARHLLSDHDVRQFTEGVDHVASDPGRAQAWGMVNKVTESFKSSFTKSSPLSGVVDFSGDQAYGRFQQAAYDLFNAELTAKGSPQAAEEDMSNPSSPNYLGRLVAKLTPTAADHAADIAKWAGHPGGGAPNPLTMP